MESTLFIPGRELRIEYPSHNRLDLPLEFVERNIRVVDVRDYHCRPLSVEGFVSRPLVRRGSLLILADDLDLGGPTRKFWMEAIRGIDDLPSHRLGLYDPEAPDEMPDWIAKPFRPTVRERLKMRSAIERFNQLERARGPCGLTLGAFAVEG
jgi:hypothetical protein